MADGEEAGDVGEAIGRMMVGLGAQLSATMDQATAPERWQYELVSWARVNELGAQGWKLLAAHIELTSFVMGRQLGPADAAEAFAREAAAEQAFGLPNITTPGEST